jgi:hypothetical protein
MIFGRLLHGQLGWLGALENLIDIGGSASVQVVAIVP